MAWKLGDPVQSNHNYPMPNPDCYIYFYHLGKYIILPTYPESIGDGQAPGYTPASPLLRSAPIQSYTGTGSRTLSFNFKLHRDEIYQLNYKNKSVNGIKIENDDYVDLMAKWIQAAAVPEYTLADKMVSPPMLAIKIGNECFIKGVVSGPVQVTYDLPILTDGRYAQITIQFAIAEVVPYTASKIAEIGSYRNLDYSLETSDIYTTMR